MDLVISILFFYEGYIINNYSDMRFCVLQSAGRYGYLKKRSRLFGLQENYDQG